MVMLCFSVFVSPAREWELFYLIFSGSIGAMVAVVYQRRRPKAQLSIKKITTVASTVGVVGGILFFVSNAIIFIVVANKNIVFSADSLRLAMIGVVQLTVAAGVGGLAVALLLGLTMRAGKKSQN